LAALLLGSEVLLLLARFDASAIRHNPNLQEMYFILIKYNNGHALALAVIALARRVFAMAIQKVAENAALGLVWAMTDIW
jgi:hypothetical protein